MDAEHLAWFGGWVADQRHRRRFTTQEFADHCGIKRPTISAIESWARRGSQTSPGIVSRLAGGLGFPILPVAIAAGGFERSIFGKAEEAIFAIMPDMRSLLPDQRSRHWSAIGARFLTNIAEETHSTVDVIEERWNKTTSKTIPVEWGLLMSHGFLKPWIMLDQMPGAALWALTEAIGGNAGDVTALTALMGRFGPTTAHRWHLHDDYAAWVAVVEVQGWGRDFERFDPFEYRRATHEIPWTTWVPKADEKTPATTADDTLCALIQRLDPEERQLIAGIVERLLRT